MRDGAAVELTVLTNRRPAQLAPLLDVAAIAGALEERHCGDEATCRAVRAFATSKQHCRVRVSTAAEIGLTPEAIVTFARHTLSETDSARAATSDQAIQVLCAGPARPAQLPARAAFALAAHIAAKVDGYVHDLLGACRIEPSRAFDDRVIVSPLGARAFSPKRHLSFRDRPAREGGVILSTRGMTHFGAPDIETGAVPPSSMPSMTRVLAAVATQIVSKGRVPSVSVTSSDIARAEGESAKWLEDDDAPSTGVRFELDVVKLQNGEDSTYVTLVPPGGANPESYVAADRLLFGSTDETAIIQHDAALRAASGRAKARLPKVLARLAETKDAGARVVVKLPFDIPGAKGSHEWMWVEVISFDETTVVGFLENDPEYIPELRAGMKVIGKRADVFDYVARWADGQTEGGETSEIISKRHAVAAPNGIGVGTGANVMH